MRIEFLEFSLDFEFKCLVIKYTYVFLLSSSDFTNKLHPIMNLNINYYYFILLNYFLSQN